MPLRFPRRLGLAVAIVALATSPPLLLAAPRPPEPKSYSTQSASSLLATFWRWFGLISPENRCTLDPNGVQHCTPDTGNQLPAPPSSHRRISIAQASGAGHSSLANRCTVDPNGGQQCSPNGGN